MQNPLNLQIPTIIFLQINPNIPNFTIVMGSHYDCEQQHTLRQFNSLKVKPCIEAPYNIQHAKVRARVNVRAKAERVEDLKVKLTPSRKEKFVFDAQLNSDVLIEPYGTTIQYLFLSLCIH